VPRDRCCAAAVASNTCTAAPTPMLGNAMRAGSGAHLCSGGGMRRLASCHLLLAVCSKGCSDKGEVIRSNGRIKCRRQQQWRAPAAVVMQHHAPSSGAARPGTSYPALTCRCYRPCIDCCCRWAGRLQQGLQFLSHALRQLDGGLLVSALLGATQRRLHDRPGTHLAVKSMRRAGVRKPRVQSGCTPLAGGPNRPHTPWEESAP